jgi:hypothetical protein
MCTHCFFHLLVVSKVMSSLSIPEWTKRVVIWRGWLITVCSMLQPLEVQLLVGVSIVDSSACIGIITRCYPWPAFCSDGWFRLVPECLIVTDTLQCCVTMSYSVVYFLAVAGGSSSYPQWLCVKMWKYTTDICSWHTSGQKNNIILLFFGTDGKWSIHINFVVMMLQLQFNIWTSQHCWEFMCVQAFTMSNITDTKEI